jgi:hypothetical protein
MSDWGHAIQTENQSAKTVNQTSNKISTHLRGRDCGFNQR